MCDSWSGQTGIRFGKPGATLPNHILPTKTSLKTPKKARGRLIPVMKAAKSAGLKSTLIMDKVKVERIFYSTDQLDELPDK